MDQSGIKFLKFCPDDRLTPEEEEELFSLMNVTKADEELEKLVFESASDVEPVASTQNWKQIWDNIRSNTIESEKKVPALVLEGYAVTAWLILIVAAGGFFIWSKQRK